jgi:hypothetical protein
MAPLQRQTSEACEMRATTTCRLRPAPRAIEVCAPHFEEALWRWRQTLYEEVKAIAYGLDLEDAHRVMRAMQESFG